MRFHSRFFVFAGIAAVLTACNGSGGLAPQLEQQASNATSAQGDAPFKYSVNPKVRRMGDVLFHNCPGGNLCALSPTTLRTAYDFSYVQGTQDGSGQTIVIVDAFGSPTISGTSAAAPGDLQKFSTEFGLPQPVVAANLQCTAATTFCVVYPGGKPSINLNNATQLGWAEETTLDVEWAHASAPGAKIVLIVSNNDQGQTIQAAQQYAVATYRNSVMSLSFGAPEASIGANNTQISEARPIYETQAPANYITVIASAGDAGSSGGFALVNAQFPASDPYVLAVGGTNLTLFNNGRYRSEAAWNDGIGCAQPCGATGGAPSIIFTPPTYDGSLKGAALSNQYALTGSKTREVADVAYDAADTAVDVYIGFSGGGVTPGWYAIGGTSVGPPIYAGIVAIANQLRGAKGALGFMTNGLYGAYTAAQLTKTPPFHNVTNGNNIFAANIGCCSAGSGYNMPTGLGTPDINNLFTVLKNL